MPFNVSGVTISALDSFSSIDSAVIQTGLVLYYNANFNFSYPGSGSVWYDTSIYSNYGNLNNTTYTANDGGAIIFNGSNSFGSIVNTTELRPSTELTVCMWLKANAITSGWVRLLGQDPYTGGYLIFLESGGSLIRALAYPNGVEVRCNTNYSISTTSWTHAVFTFQMGDAIRSYFNGVASTTVGLEPGTFSYATNPILFGQVGASWYNGQIGGIQIYNRALVQEEVSINFNVERTRYGV